MRGSELRDAGFALHLTKPVDASVFVNAVGMTAKGESARFAAEMALKARQRCGPPSPPWTLKIEEAFEGDLADIGPRSKLLGSLQPTLQKLERAPLAFPRSAAGIATVLTEPVLFGGFPVPALRILFCVDEAPELHSVQLLICQVVGQAFEMPLR